LTKKGVDIIPEIKKVDIKLVGKIDLDKTLKPKTQKPEAPAEVQEKKVHKEAPVQEVTEKKKVSDTKEKEAVKEAVKEDQKSPIDLHIVGKIDLETVTKEAKTPKKEEKGKPEERSRKLYRPGKQRRKVLQKKRRIRLKKL